MESIGAATGFPNIFKPADSETKICYGKALPKSMLMVGFVLYVCMLTAEVPKGKGCIYRKNYGL